MGAILSLDFETASLSDLAAVGADVYARDPSLAVTVIAWAFDDGPVHSATHPAALPEAVRAHLLDGGIFRAWNAAFESAILTHHYGLALDPRQASCTMQRALYSGLPAALGDAGPAIGVEIVKDKSARQLMLRMARPRAILRDGSARWWHEDDPAKLEALRAYCERDVESERAIGRAVRELPPGEWEVSLLDRRVNDRGINIDLVLTDRLLAITESETRKLNRECERLTGGAVKRPGSETARLLEWLVAHGAPLKDLGKETVSSALAGPPLVHTPDALYVLNDDTRRVLEIRREVAKSSLKKLVAMKRCAGPDGRVRGQLAYYGASRTGRFAGRLIQPQNFPRPAIKLAGLAVQAILEGAPAEFLRLVWGSPMDVATSLLRGCLVPGPGKLFAVYDLAQIEARVVAWLAGQRDVLDVFERGEDVYTWTARRQGSTDRQLGKVMVLGLGYGLGPERFRETAAKYGITLTRSEAESAVRDWREANPKIVDLWWMLDRAARTALAGFKRPVTRTINDNLSLTASLSGTGRTLMTIALPSGRRLYYRNARLETLEGETRESIVTDGVNQFTKRWTALRTYGAKICENCLTGDTLVLTGRGWTAIADVRIGDKVWDGDAWISHGGVACNGERETIMLDGVRMTPDHKVLTTKGWIHASSCEGLDRAPVALPDSAEIPGIGWQEIHLDSPLRLRDRESNDSGGVFKRQGEVLRLSALRPNASDSRDVQTSGIRGVAFNARPLPTADAPSLEELWQAWDHGLSRMGRKLQSVLAGHGANLPVRADYRTGRQQRRLFGGKLHLGDLQNTSAQHSAFTSHRDALGRDDGDGSIRAQRNRRDDAAVPNRPRREPVFDILDAGHNHRFVVAGLTGPFTVHNCVQAIARDVIVEAALRVDAARLGDLVLSVHDELVFEVPADNAHALAPRIKAAVDQRPAWALDLPVASEGGIISRYVK